MKVERALDAWQCGEEIWVVTGDPLPPPSGPGFVRPTAYTLWRFAGWDVASANVAHTPLDPTKGGE